MKEKICPNLGFSILRDADALRHRILSGGPASIISLLKALIWSHTGDRKEIVEEVCALGGEHLRSVAELTLVAGIDKHWVKRPNGTYALLVEYA